MLVYSHSDCLHNIVKLSWVHPEDVALNTFFFEDLLDMAGNEYYHKIVI